MLNRAELNYNTTKKECLAVAVAVQQFRTCLYSCLFGVVTDHHSLCWFTNLCDLSGRLAHWALRLQGFDFTVSYKRERKHKDADSLSCTRSSSCTVDDLDGYLSSITNIFSNLDSLRHDQRQHHSERYFEREKSLQSFTHRDVLLYKRTMNVDEACWLLVVPHSLQTEILRATHEDPTSGHSGFAHTFACMSQRFFRSGMQ